MPHRSIALLLCAALGLGGSASARTLYRCSMTGQETVAGCCCAVQGVCADRAGAGHHRRQAFVAPVCCTVKHEKAATASARSKAATESWRGTLDLARHHISPLPLPPVAGTRASLKARCLHEEPRRPPPPPIFLLHQVFLI